MQIVTDGKSETCIGNNSIQYCHKNVTFIIYQNEYKRILNEYCDVFHARRE